MHEDKDCVEYLNEHKNSKLNFDLLVSTILGWLVEIFRDVQIFTLQLLSSRPAIEIYEGLVVHGINL